MHYALERKTINTILVTTGYLETKMADDADRADERIENAKDDGINEARRFVAKIPKGHAGECDYCGEHSKRIVNDACAKCRDRYRLE